MNKNQHIEISKFLSYILRHKPEAIELQLDTEGWVNLPFCYIYLPLQD